MNTQIQGLVKKYLSGEVMNLEEISQVESFLLQNISETESISTTLPSIIISQDVEEGIAYWASSTIQKDLEIVEKELYQEGFFINRETIDGYFNEELNKADRAIFENRLKSDEVFAKEIDTHIDLLKGIDVFGERNIRTELSEIQEDLDNDGFFNASKKQETTFKIRELKKESKIVSINRRVIISIAASVLLFVGSWWFLNNSETTSQNDFYSSYYQPYQDVLTDEILDELESFGFADGSEKERLTSLQKCMGDYQEQKYEEAISKFENHLNQYTDDKDAQFYLAVSSLAIKKNNKAISILTTLSEKNTFRFHKESQWYLALAHLGAGQNENANQLLFIIIAADEKSNFKNKAKEIISKLKK